MPFFPPPYISENCNNRVNMKPKSLPSRLFQRDSPATASGKSPSRSAAKYERHVDCVDHPELLDPSLSNDGQQTADSNRQHEKCHRETLFAFLPERYEPLVDDEAKAKAKEEKKKKKKENYKKVKKVCVFLFLHIFFLTVQFSKSKFKVANSLCVSSLMTVFLQIFFLLHRVSVGKLKCFQYEINQLQSNYFNLFDQGLNNS